MSLEDAAVLEKLRTRFCERLVRELPLLLAHQQSAAPSSDDEAHQALIRLAHGLAGAGGTFGFANISVEAAALENCLRHNGDEQAVESALCKLIDVVTEAIPDTAAPNRA